VFSPLYLDEPPEAVIKACPAAAPCGPKGICDLDVGLQRHVTSPFGFCDTSKTAYLRPGCVAAWLPLATRLQRALRLSFDRVGTCLFGHNSASESPIIPSKLTMRLLTGSIARPRSYAAKPDVEHRYPTSHIPYLISHISYVL